MRLVALMENTTTDERLTCAHGLSVYIETPLHRILMDTGPNEAFAENAHEIGIDLALVDVAVLSHGHFDHAGGIARFCQENATAPLYVHAQAAGPHYAARADGSFEYIGMSEEALSYKDRFITTGDICTIDSEITLFSVIPTADLLSSSNKSLLIKQGEDMVCDPFLHEQNLIVNAEGKRILVSGCAHRGIVNIMRAAEEIAGAPLDAVIGGFHLSNPGLGGSEPQELVDAVADELAARNARYFTGHCTGSVAWERLKERLGDQIDYLATGTDVTL